MRRGSPSTAPGRSSCYPLAAMALTATIFHFTITVADVDRGVYESLDLRVALHPSEAMRYLLTRTLAYCLSYEDGIAFSKGGLSSSEEAPLSIVDRAGVLRAWIDIGQPSAERLHKASKAAGRVLIYTHAPMEHLWREASTRAIHKVEDIAVYRFEPAFLDAIEAEVQRNTTMEITRNDGHLYVTVGQLAIDAPLAAASLVRPSA